MENRWLRKENRTQTVSFSQSIAYFSRYYLNDRIFLYHLFETSVPTPNAIVHIDKVIISSSFERISFRNISHSRNLSHHKFSRPSLNSKTNINGSARIPYIISETNSVVISRGTKDSFGTSHLWTFLVSLNY